MTRRYVVTNTILSRATGSTPADVTYYRGEDEGQALSALLSAATLRGAGDDTDLPESMQFDVTSVRLDTFVVADPEPEDGLICILCKQLGMNHDGDHIVPGEPV